MTKNKTAITLMIERTPDAQVGRPAGHGQTHLTIPLQSVQYWYPQCINQNQVHHPKPRFVRLVLEE